MIKSLLSFALFFSLSTWLMWKFVVVKQWVADVEYEGNVRADLALEELADDEMTEFPEPEVFTEDEKEGGDEAEKKK